MFICTKRWKSKQEIKADVIVNHTGGHFYYAAAAGAGDWLDNGAGATAGHRFN